MVLRPRSIFRREIFPDGDTWCEALYHGGATPGVDFDLSHVTGYYGEKLRAIWGEAPDNLSSYDYLEREQQSRPDIFVRKLQSRRLFVPSSADDRPERLNTSTYVTPKDFAEHYAAAAFAAHSGLTCETMVTLWWGALDASEARQAQILFSKITKQFNDWCFQRSLPTVYFFSHESSPKIALHTHLAVYLCLGLHSDATRDEFRIWAMGWPERNGLGKRPRAIRVTGPTKRTPWLHWHRFHYQVKGYDPRAVVRQAYNSTSGTDVMLSDLIAWPWRDPGVVTMAPRLGHALNLGKDRRLAGIPKHCDELRNPPRPKKPVVPRELSLEEQLRYYSPPARPRPPFVSRYDDGWRDVRCLYPREFNTRVTKLSYEPEPLRQGPPPDDFQLDMELI